MYFLSAVVPRRYVGKVKKIIEEEGCNIPIHDHGADHVYIIVCTTHRILSDIVSKASKHGISLSFPRSSFISGKKIRNLRRAIEKTLATVELNQPEEVYLRGARDVLWIAEILNLKVYGG